MMERGGGCYIFGQGRFEKAIFLGKILGKAIFVGYILGVWLEEERAEKLEVECAT